MDTLRFLFSIEKSSRRGVLLFLLMAASLASLASESCVADTIIIGGKKLIVQRELTYDTLGTPGETLEPKKQKKRLRLGDWKVGFNVAGYLPLDEVRPETAGYSSINAFVGADRRRGNGMGFMVWTERKLGKQGWHLHAGIGMDYLTGRNLSFDTSQIDDSLFAFASFNEDELDQILLFRFDIGSETDTLPVDLFDAGYQSNWLRVPLGLSYERELSKKTILRFGAGLDLRILLDSELPEFIFLPDLGNEVITYAPDTDNLKFKPFTLTPWLSAGARWQMDRRWWLTTEVRGNLPQRPLLANDLFTINRVLFAGQVGVCYLFGR
jgi:hypothetical protein